jgi:hypothetical protein
MNADVSLVSHKLITALETQPVANEEEEVEVHPLLLATSSSGRTAEEAAARRAAAAAEVAEKIETLKKPRSRKMYLMTDRTSAAAAAVDAYFLQTAQSRIHFNPATGAHLRNENGELIHPRGGGTDAATGAGDGGLGNGAAATPLHEMIPIGGQDKNELKFSNVRVSDRIPKGTLALHSVAPLFLEFDQQVDPKALEQMDVGLYRHAEVKLMYVTLLV